MRVLHIFAPNFKQRFGGPIFDWKYAFSHWDDPEVLHLVLDYDRNCPLSSKEAFDFEVSDSQVLSPRWKRVLWAFTLIKNLFRYRRNYDIVHFHLLWWGGLLAAAWAKSKGIPTIYQSVLLDSDTPGAIRKQSLGRIKEKLLRTFSVIVPISEALAEDYYLHGYTKDHVITLMNSVDTKLFHPSTSLYEKRVLRKKFGLPLDVLILLFAGSIIQRKGVDILLKGFIEVSQRFPDLYLLLVGPKNQGENPSLDESYVNDLHVLIDEKQFEARVKFTGLIKNRHDMADLYRAADYFVFPSRKEGLPNVVLEAMASGLPVVVSDIPGLKNVIKDGKNGVIFPSEDINALTTALQSLIMNAETRMRFGSCARRYILEAHSFPVWQASLSEIYRSMISATGNDWTD